MVALPSYMSNMLSSWVGNGKKFTFEGIIEVWV